jgi:amino acid adenylation domain-containing protein
MTLLAGFATLLARYSGQWDVPIGTPVAGRDRPEVTDVVGFFLNSLVVRCDLRPELTFAQAVRRVREVATEAFAHQQLPFERLVDELAAERDLSRTPLYQVAFDLQDEGATSVVTADATAMDAFQRAWRVAKTDLTLFMWRGVDGRLDGAFEFATSIFDDATVARLADHFVRLLRAAVDAPSTRLDRLDLLAPDEQAWLVTGCNSTAVDRDGASVLDLFEVQAAATPGAVAVRCGDSVVSYAELDSRANQIAHQLRASGIGSEATVGVLLDRGPKLLASLLAVWKTGAAYVPIDPGYPAERVRGMLTDAGAQLAITSSAYSERFSVATLLVDTHALLIAASPCAPLPRVADPDRLAYVIFTSGSTGRPKGVQITHRGLANHVRWAADELASQGTGGAPLFSSVAFDLVVPNLWAPLVTGQPVVMIEPSVDLAGLGAAIAAAGPFSFIKLTPGHLELLSHQLDRAQAQRLASVIVVAGEALSGELADRWYELLGPGRLINEYGPTEASVGTCTYPVVARQGVDVVPIGRPLPNLTMHVLDETLRPVPAGVVGELYVGGTGVARGYAGRPDLTADRFGPDPWGPPGARLYRTGDLARRRPDGVVDFLGRVDDQVKINGYRIEPGELHAVLASHPGVRNVCVLVRDQRLVAYYVGDADDLTEYCARRLPDFMIPDWIVAVPHIPLNANGKVDRAALPDPRTASGPEAAVAPRTVVEERIAEIWAELLGRRVGVFDSFFKEGGHSILAVRLISLLHEEFELDLSIRLIFERPTIAGLAEAVEEQIRAEIDALSDAELSAEPSGEHPA